MHLREQAKKHARIQLRFPVLSCGRLFVLLHEF